MLLPVFWISLCLVHSFVKEFGKRLIDHFLAETEFMPPLGFTFPLPSKCKKTRRSNILLWLSKKKVFSREKFRPISSLFSRESNFSFRKWEMTGVQKLENCIGSWVTWSPCEPVCHINSNLPEHCQKRILFFPSSRSFHLDFELWSLLSSAKCSVAATLDNVFSSSLYEIFSILPYMGLSWNKSHRVRFPGFGPTFLLSPWCRLRRFPCFWANFKRRRVVNILTGFLLAEN